MATEYTGEIIPVGGKEYTGEVVSSPKEKSSAYDDFMKIPRALYGPVEAATTVGTGLASGLAGTLYGAAKHYGEQPGSGAGRGPLAAEKEAQEFQQKYTYEPRTESGKQIVGGIAKGAQALERTGIPQAMMPLAGLTGELSAVGQLAKPAAQYARAATQPLTEGLKTAVTSPLTKAAEIAVGKTTPSTEKSIRQREKQGYVLEPGQLKEQEPLGSPGFSAIGTSKIQRKNQTLANQDASKETGNIASYGQLDGEHLKNTKKALGEEYGKIFGTKENPKEIQIDEKLVNLAQQAKDFEQSVGPAGAGTIGKTADNIIKRFDEIQQATPQFAGGVDGRELQALRSNLSDFAYRTEGLEKKRAYDLLRAIDDAIEQSNNQLAPKLKEVNRRYAANEALLDLYQKGGIKQGNISLERLWNVTKNFGESHPLYDLGKFGHDARLRAIWEGREKPPTELGRYLSMGKRATLGLALDSPLGRALQRKISEPQP